jgi:hypothetical protein
MLHAKATDKKFFGDVKATGEAISAAMRDAECDPATLALLLRDAGEAATKVKPGSEWQPTMGFKPWFGVTLTLRHGEARFSKGIYAAYEALATKVANGFTDTAGDGTVYPPNPNFADASMLSAETVFKALADEGALSITRYGALRRIDAPKSGRAPKPNPTDLA